MTSSEAEIRKVQITGKGTFVVSLPKWWVKALKLKKGDLIEIRPLLSSSLIVSLHKKKTSRDSLFIYLDASQFESVDDLFRNIISNYLIGYDVFRISLKDKNALYKMELKENSLELK